MPDDDMTSALLADYVEIAKNLRSSVNVSTETMNRYHGMTGALLAKCVMALWTQDELEKQIDLRVAEKCLHCPNTTVLQQWRSQQSADDAAGVKSEGKAPKWLAFAHALVPYRWPAVLICFSPFAGDIITKLVSVFSKQ